MLYSKHFLFCILIQQRSLQDLLLGKDLTSLFVFKDCYIEGLTSDDDNFDYFLQLKVKNIVHSRIFKDHNPNSRTFQGLEFLLRIPGLFRVFKDRGNPEKAHFRSPFIRKHVVLTCFT